MQINFKIFKRRIKTMEDKELKERFIDEKTGI